jgi:hypothetical protein
MKRFVSAHGCSGHSLLVLTWQATEPEAAEARGSGEHHVKPCLPSFSAAAAAAAAA